MDTMTMVETIERLLLERTVVPFAHGEIEAIPAFDRDRGRYLLMVAGWDRGQRVHGVILHPRLRGEMIWVERDGTEDGSATELAASGVPSERIVLAFYHERERADTGYAVA